MICPECRSEFVDTTTRCVCLTCGWQAMSDPTEQKTPYDPFTSNLRGTGRTTRMLVEAANLGMGGKNVFVLANSDAQARDLMEQTWDFLPNPLIRSYATGRYLLHSGGEINFVTPEEIRFNWELMRATVYGPETIYLVDHHVIETKFRKILEMLHRWDPKTEENPQ